MRSYPAELAERLILQNVIYAISRPEARLVEINIQAYMKNNHHNIRLRRGLLPT